MNPQITAAEVAKHLIDGPREAPPIVPVAELLMRYPELRSPIIHGLLRQGESMNVIAPPKTGKSWLTLSLALCVATGRRWLETFETVASQVLIIDNELHLETISNRIPRVAASLGISVTELSHQLSIYSLRGKLEDIFGLGAYLKSLEPGRFSLIVLDAFYRFMPANSDENDNGTMASIYNHIDAMADHLKCAFVLIHHSTKGNQSSKAITDVGAGAGAQARATDTHLVLRPHAEKGVVVLDAALRSWPPLPQPVCLRWEYPVWALATGLDPHALKPERVARKTKSADAPTPVVHTPESFTADFLSAEPKVKANIMASALAAQIPERRAATMLLAAVDRGIVFKWPGTSKTPDRFGTSKPPSELDACARAHPPHPPESRKRAPGRGKNARKRKGSKGE